MHKIHIEVITIGFHNCEELASSLSFINKNQNSFLFTRFNDDRFINYKPQNGFFYTTNEIYKLIDDIFKDSKGFHHLAIAIVDKRLDGTTLGNLFGSMQTNENDRLTGKAIASTYRVYDIIKPIPIKIYYSFELLSFSIRFIVGAGMIHDKEEGCIFHNKINKRDMITTLESGYISLNSLQLINKHLEFEQIQQIQNMLTKLAHMARLSKLDKPSHPHNNNVSPIFISYSHADKEWLKRLQIHIRPFEREGLIYSWDDTKIKPGMNWKEEIKNALNNAKIAILLVSADFLASDFIAENELSPLLLAAEQHGTLILPVILKPCSFSHSELSKFQSLNPPSEPLIKLSEADQEELFVKIINIIKNSND